MEKEKILCPSHSCEENTILVGIVMSDGRLAYSSDRLVINREFVETARQGRSPEKRFRFAGNCVQGGCNQWTGTRCGVIDKIVEIAAPDENTADLPHCSIRSQCRWFFQSGKKACAICPEIVTDMRE